MNYAGISHWGTPHLFVVLIIALFLLSFFLFGGIQVSPAPSAAASGKVVARVPFANKSGLIVVPVSINGSKELNMVLDSGMSMGLVILFHKETGEELGLDYTQTVFLGGAGGRNQKSGRLSLGDRIRLDSLEMDSQRVIVIDETREESSWSWDGIIGKSLFDAYVAEIDYSRSMITFYEPAAFSVNTPAEPISLNIDSGFPIIEGGMILDDGTKIPVKLVVDLGHRNTLFVQENTQKNLHRPERTIENAAGRGIQGEITGRMGRIKELRIAGIRIPDIIVSFLSPETNMGIPSTIADGDIGNLILNRFTVILDYSRKQMFLLPNERFQAPFEMNMAGLDLERDAEGKALVRYVIRNSPAEAVGIRRGDRILLFDGKDVTEFLFDELFALFRTEGKRITLTIQRGNERLEKILKLKRMI